MGLDMYAYATKHKPAREVDFDTPRDIEEAWEVVRASDYKADSPEFFYWRKHPNLHGWMHRLYEEKGGQSEHGFNGDNLVLTLADLVRLEADVLTNSLPSTSGFFFGESTREDFEDDMEFIKLAREKIAEGKTVYYTSSW